MSVLGSDPSREATRLLLKNSADPSVGLGAVHPALQVGVVLRPGVEAIHSDGHLGCYECHRGDPFLFGTAVVWTALECLDERLWSSVDATWLDRSIERDRARA